MDVSGVDEVKDVEMRKEVEVVVPGTLLHICSYLYNLIKYRVMF